MNVYFIDTSIFLNILDVPGRNSEREDVLKRLKELIEDNRNTSLILPFATIIETGNHIAHCDNGNARRDAADRFKKYINKMIDDEAPWSYYGEQFGVEDLRKICESFPDKAMRGFGIGDLSIIQAYEKYKANAVAVNRISIWSLDEHLCSYSEELTPMSLRNNHSSN